MRSSRQHLKTILALIMLLAIFVGPKIADAATIGMPTNFLTINKGLIDWWTMDGKDSLWTTQSSGTSLDRVGGNSGTFVSMAQSTALVPGRIGQGYKFNAAGDSMTMGDLSNADFGTSDFTIGVWIKTPPITNGPTYVTIMDKRSVCNWGNQWMFSLAANALPSATTAGFNVDESAPGDSLDVSGTVDVGDNKWHHILVTRSGTLYNFYSDGRLDGTGNSPTNINFSNSASLNVGTGVCAGVDGSAAYSGVLDDFRIYNRVLSATEIRQLYNLGSTRSGIAPINSLATGLVGWWTMDGKDTIQNIRDSSGQGNNAHLVGFTSTTTTVGKIGQAISFTNGVNQDILTPLTPSGAVFTLSAWVNNKGITGLNEGHVVEFAPLQMWIDSSDRVNFYSGSSYTLSPPTIPKNTWKHLVFLCTATGHFIYIDGVLATPSNDANACSSASGPVYIGRWSSGGAAEVFNGSIDDVRVYNRALTDNEILQLYRLGTGKQNVTVSGSSPNNLTGWWTFDGKDIIQNIRDSSGQGNNANLVGYTSTTTTVGKVGQALLFNGTSQYATMSSTPAPGSEFTINAWVKPTSGNGFVVYRGDKSCCLSYKLFLASSAVSFGVAVGPGGNSDYQANSASTVNTSGRVWTMLTGVFSSSGNITAVYINGVLDGTPDIGAGTIANSVPTTNIGADNSAANYLTGAIDDVRTYNKALSAAEVMKLYKQGK